MGVDQTLKRYLTSGEDWTRHKSGSVVGRHLLGFLNFVSSVALAVETDAGLGDDDDGKVSVRSTGAQGAGT